MIFHFVFRIFIFTNSLVQSRFECAHLCTHTRLHRLFPTHSAVLFASVQLPWQRSTTPLFNTARLSLSRSVPSVHGFPYLCKVLEKGGDIVNGVVVGRGTLVCSAMPSRTLVQRSFFQDVRGTRLRKLDAVWNPDLFEKVPSSAHWATSLATLSKSAAFGFSDADHSSVSAHRNPRGEPSRRKASSASTHFRDIF